MPMVGFICPVERSEVPFDHFETCDKKRGRPAFPPWYARLIAQKEKADVRHAGIDLTITRCMGCPRANYIEAFLPYYIDPMKAYARIRGTMQHESCAKACDPAHWVTEEADPVRCEVHGRLFPGAFPETEGASKLVTAEGVATSAKLDLMRHDKVGGGPPCILEIADMKFPLDWNVRWRKWLAKPDNQAQLNMQRILLGQQQWALDGGFDPETVQMTVWDHGTGMQEGPLGTVVELMDEAAILKLVPGSLWTWANNRWALKSPAKYSIADITALHMQMLEMHRDVVRDDQEKFAASIPCTGKYKWGGKGCSGYCDVHRLSEKLQIKYGRAEELGVFGV